MITRFNQATQWVATEIVMPEKESVRTKKLRWFIEVAVVSLALFFFSLLLLFVL
jgi:hypothetical protein